MDYTKSNFKEAKRIAKEVQREIDKKREELQHQSIKRITIQAAYDHFLRNNSNKNSNTIYLYNYFFRYFTKKFSTGQPCTTIMKRTVEDWLIDIDQLEKSKNTKHILCKNLKKFLSFLFEYSYLPYFKLNRDLVIGPEKREIVTFTTKDIVKLFNGLKDKSLNFKTTIYLLFYTGLRPTDILNFKVENINWDDNTIQYYSQKSDEYFFVPIHNDLIPILKERSEELKSGKLLQYFDVHNMGRAYREYLKEIDLHKKNYTLRTFRKTFISLAYDQDMELAMVASLVGHKKITTTKQYYHKLSNKKRAAELNKLKFTIEDNGKTEVDSE